MNIFKIIQGWVRLKGNTDGTFIGNDGDCLKVKPIQDQANRSAFGDNMTESLEPITQISATYGIGLDAETFTATNGTVTSSDAMFECNITTDIGSYAVIRTQKSILYREGQGLSCRITSIFDGNAVANSLQFAGFFNLTDTIAFGYRGANFGILHDTYGSPEIRQLAITASGNGNLTLTLDGTAYVIPITSGSVQHNAYEIEKWMNENQSIWRVQQEDDKVIFQAEDTSSRNGTYSISGTTLTGTFSQIKSGTAKTESTVLQTSWDNNPSWFDPTKANVYMIKKSYLGFGPIKFFIMNNDTGEFELVHTLKFIGIATKPNTSKRALKVGWVCASLGSTTALTVKGASAGAFIEGNSKSFGPQHSISATNTSVGSTYVSVLSIRAKDVFKDDVMLGRIVPIRVSVTNDATKPVEYIVAKNRGFGETNYLSHGTQSITQEDIATRNNVTVSTNDSVEGGAMSAGGSDTKDLRPLDVDLQSGESLTVFARKTSGTNPAVTARITWKEDF